MRNTREARDMHAVGLFKRPKLCSKSPIVDLMLYGLPCTGSLDFSPKLTYIPVWFVYQLTPSLSVSHTQKDALELLLGEFVEVIPPFFLTKLHCTSLESLCCLGILYHFINFRGSCRRSAGVWPWYSWITICTDFRAFWRC